MSLSVPANDNTGKVLCCEECFYDEFYMLETATGIFVLCGACHAEYAKILEK